MGLLTLVTNSGVPSAQRCSRRSVARRRANVRHPCGAVIGPMQSRPGTWNRRGDAHGKRGPGERRRTPSRSSAGTATWCGGCRTPTPRRAPAAGGVRIRMSCARPFLSARLGAFLRANRVHPVETQRYPATVMLLSGRMFDVLPGAVRMQVWSAPSTSEQTPRDPMEGITPASSRPRKARPSARSAVAE